MQESATGKQQSLHFFPVFFSCLLHLEVVSYTISPQNTHQLLLFIAAFLQTCSVKL